LSGPVQRIIESNGIRLNIAEQGNGPPVILCHGFPESWYSWRHQLTALAAAGFHAVAADMRGYGKSDRPEAIDQYTIFHLIGDLVGLLDAIEAHTAVIVGHDWGAQIAWQAARLRPDRFRAVASLSVPLRPRGPARPTSVMPQTADAQFYQLYFQQPGVAEAEMERDPRITVLSSLYGISGEGAAAYRAAAARGEKTGTPGMVPRNGSWLREPVLPPELPAWLTDTDIDFYYYRNLDRNWELMAAFAGVTLKVPALFIAGDHDMVMAAPPGLDQHLANLRQFVTTLRDVRILPGCGHWTQQERPSEVNAAIIDFIRGLPD
jgi:pimeloyl-ACP methyl ester carboxylesterase